MALPNVLVVPKALAISPIPIRNENRTAEDDSNITWSMDTIISAISMFNRGVRYMLLGPVANDT